MKALLCVLVVLAASPSAIAQCCHHCGCQSNCRKVCRPVCETKKVPKVTYDCECEDFCIPGPSCRSTVCDDCGHKKHVYTPTCGKVHTRTKLIKKETMEEKISYKWVVETLCCGCEARCAAAENATVTVDALGMATLIPATMNPATMNLATMTPASQTPAPMEQQRVAPAAYQQAVPEPTPVDANSPADTQPKSRRASPLSKLSLERVLSPWFGKSTTKDDGAAAQETTAAAPR